MINWNKRPCADFQRGGMENVRNGNANLVDNTGTAIKNARKYSKQRTIKKKSYKIRLTDSRFLCSFRPHLDLKPKTWSHKIKYTEECGPNRRRITFIYVAFISVYIFLSFFLIIIFSSHPFLVLPPIIYSLFVYFSFWSLLLLRQSSVGIVFKIMRNAKRSFR